MNLAEVLPHSLRTKETEGVSIRSKNKVKQLLEVAFKSRRGE
jgi:hypothetical protein